MSKFKVGDIVRRINSHNAWEYKGVSYVLPVGTVCRVTHVQGVWIATPTETFPCRNGEDELLFSHEDNFELVDIPKPQPAVVKPPFNPFTFTYGQSRGARLAAQAVAGGLQQHSIGGTYPFHPVAFANGDKVHWEVHNLRACTIMCDPVTDQPFVHDTAEGAINRLRAFLDDRLNHTGYVWLRHPLPIKPAPAAELTPREAYQAAMEKEADYA